MSLRKVRVLYQSKNNITGLTDVKGQVYLNQVAKAVGVGALTFTELDATNAPGVYYLDIATASLVTWGVVEGGTNTLEIVIDSASKPAEAIFKQDVVVDNTDDIFTRVGAPAGASVSADIAAVKSDTAAIKVDLESGANSLANIYAGIQAIQNNAGFAVPVPEQLLVPSSGSNLYQVPLTIYNEKNQLIDPDSNTITVSLVNQAGTDRSSYLTGNSGGTAPAVRDSLGQYHIDLTILAGAPIEELLFSFDYSIGGIATARRAVTETVNTLSGDVAQQTTLLDVQGDVDAIETIVTDIQSTVNSTATAVAAVQADLTNNVEGASFDNTLDSLHAQSVYMRTYLFTGGRAV